MKIILWILILFAAVIAGLIIWLSINNAKVPEKLGVENDQLSPCPKKPNCVHSQAQYQEQMIAPISYVGTIAEAKAQLKSALSSYSAEKVKIIKETDNYIHATFTSKWMHFTDDTEFLFKEGVIHIRSASRIGHSDLGANRKRIELLRTKLTTP